MQKVIEKYVNWGQPVEAVGGTVGEPQAHGRARQGDARQGTAHVRVTDGPYSETKEILGGYYVIEADSYDQAMDLARDCPQLEYGGTIEVREVDDMGA